MLQYCIVLFFVVSSEFQLGHGDECSSKVTDNPYYKLKQSLLCNYDISIRPIINRQNVINVKIRMVLKSLDYDMHRNSITVNTWLPMHWQDDYLKWDKKEYENVDRIYLPSADIWTPDLSIYSASDQSAEVGVLNDVTCIISSRGMVTCVPPVKHEGFCRAKLKKYPFDTQNCTLSFGSWVYKGEEVNFSFQSTAILKEDYQPNPEWHLLNITTGRHETRICCPNSTYPSLLYTFVLQRCPGFYGAIVIAPALAMLLMTLLILCLNPADMERFCVACCNMIAHILHLQHISWILPSGGDEVPLLIIFARDSLMLATFALILTVILKRLVCAPDDSPMWISTGITRLLGSRVGQIILLFDYSLKGVASVKGEEDGTNIIENNENNKTRDCILFAKTLDRLCFLAYFITYFCMFIAFIPEP